MSGETKSLVTTEAERWRCETAGGAGAGRLGKDAVNKPSGRDATDKR